MQAPDPQHLLFEPVMYVMPHSLLRLWNLKEENSGSHFKSTSKQSSFVLQQIAANFGRFLGACQRSSLMLVFISLITT